MATVGESAKYKTHVPVYDLVAAAGWWGRKGFRADRLDASSQHAVVARHVRRTGGWAVDGAEDPKRILVSI